MPKTNLKFKPGYQVNLAKIIKKKTGMITRTTGMIKDLNHANKILKNNSADLINFARKFINSPASLLRDAQEVLTGGITIPGLDPVTQESFKAAISGKAINQLGANVNPRNVVSRATGQVLNSNLELLFQGVNLRSFPFSITFSPRSEAEGGLVKDIIRSLKRSMLAKATNSVGNGGFSGAAAEGIMISAPDVFLLEYRSRGRVHPFLNAFKTCALTGLNVNYTNSGTYSSAIGFQTSAVGDYSTAMGYNTTSSASYCTAMGYATTASGSTSTAMGVNTTASGDGSTSLGNQTIASANNSSAMGASTTASGEVSTAMGYATTANGSTSTSMGLSTTANGEVSTAMGLGTTANGSVSVAMGRNTTASDYGSLVIGQYNSSGSGITTSSTTFDTSNTAFVIGNGTLGNLSDAFKVMFNGDASVSNNLTVMGDLEVQSDARLKSNIVSLGPTLSKLLQIDGKSYEMKGKKKIGVLAQEIQKLFPELVGADDKNRLTVNYQGLVPVLINALKEQQNEIVKLKEQEKRIERLEKLIANIN